MIFFLVQVVAAVAAAATAAMAGTAGNYIRAIMFSKKFSKQISSNQFFVSHNLHRYGGYGGYEE